MRTRPAAVITVLLLVAIVAGVVAAYGIQGSAKLPAHETPLHESQPHQPSDESATTIPADAQRTAVAKAIDITVSDESGSPIADAELVALETTARDPAHEGRCLATSDRSGRLSCNESRIPGQFVIRHARYQPLKLGDYSLVCKTRHVTLLAGATVEIETIDERGNAVADVRVKLVQSARAEGTEAQSREGRTGSEGTVAFAGLARGPFAITADSDTHIVTEIALGHSAPTSGTIRLCRPLVAFGQSRWPLDSFEGQLSASLLIKGATSEGPAQVSGTRFAEQLRGGSPDRVAFAIHSQIAGLTEADCFEVSYLAGGEWGFARLPFRRMAEGLEPTLFGDSIATPRGEVVQLVVRTKEGKEIDCSNMRLRIIPLDGPAGAHAIRVYRADQRVRLPKGKYGIESSCSAVDGSIGEKAIVIAADVPSDDVRRVELSLSRHLFSAKPRLVAPGIAPTGACIASGTVFVKSESGQADVYYSTEGNLAGEEVFLAEGVNTVRVTGLDGQVRELFVRVDTSGSGILTDAGQLVERER